VLTYRDIAAVASPMAPARLVNYEHDPDRPGRTQVLSATGPAPMAPLLAEHDIVVNCVLQNPDEPLIFVDTQELEAFAAGSLIVDVSCDAGMGFEWAQPTSFADPTFVVGDRVTYYAVDHSPSYLWDSSTWEISDALIPFLDTVMAGSDRWEADPTISRAIEIRDGVVRNPQILSFQDREAEYPHARRAATPHGR
jgi:alanine dehydrogenase